MPLDNSNYPERGLTIGEERMIRLASFLETTVPANRFTMKHWGRRFPTGFRFRGCAMTWATKIPEFKAAGLHMRWLFGSGAVFYKNCEDYFAAAVFFDLTPGQAALMFTSMGYKHELPTKDEVAAKLRAYVAARHRQVSVSNQVNYLNREHLNRDRDVVTVG